MFWLISEIQELKTNKGLALEDILREVHLFVMRSKYDIHFQNLWIMNELFKSSHF